MNSSTPLTDRKEFYIKYKDELFGLFTSLLIYSIMLPLIISEHRRVEQRYIDFDLFMVHFRQMPMTLYFLIITISLSTVVNFFRDILSVIKRYFNSKTGYNNYSAGVETDIFGVKTGLRPVPTLDNASTLVNVNQFGNTTTYPPTNEQANPNTYY
ncbi:MAG: hypothetical protein IPL26_19740 [Leptospiraceae bacterium]|nr:hypothetical protein [Leptospiraceae bacterium]